MEKFHIVQIKTNNWTEEWEKDVKACWISKYEFLHAWSEVKVTQSCPTLWDPMDYSLSGSSVHGIFQTRILEWVAISFSRRSSQHREHELDCVKCQKESCEILAIKKNETMIFAATWMDLELIILNGESEKEKEKYMISLICVN